jgi:hypothetical protein
MSTISIGFEETKEHVFFVVFGPLGAHIRGTHMDTSGNICIIIQYPDAGCNICGGCFKNHVSVPDGCDACTSISSRTVFRDT